MGYYIDLSEYAYSPSAIRAGTLNVGWLDATKPFPHGPSDPRFLEFLWAFCRVKVVRTRGFHGCYLCTPPVLDIVYDIKDGETLRLGSAEIRVFSRDGNVYAAPDMIYHYVTCHGYRPPDEFISAVMTGPPANSIDYRALLALQKFEAD